MTVNGNDACVLARCFFDCYDDDHDNDQQIRCQKTNYNITVDKLTKSLGDMKEMKIYREKAQINRLVR